jgi:hypothetical protein
MGLQIHNSDDITYLAVEVTFDISGVTPLISLVNLSEGSNLAGVSYAFIVKSPTTTFIHEGSLSSPDITGVWSTDILADPWPRPFNQIEWSGPPFSFQVLAKDSNGNEYAAPVQYAPICRPNGNTKDSKNTYGVGSLTVQSKCNEARIFFQDTTNTSYKGLSGTVGSSVLRVNFPMDDTGTVPAPFQINYFATAMVPITYSGDGYQFLYTSIYDYDFGNDVHVRIKYLKNSTFGVWCNIDLMPLVCEYEKLSNSITNGTCTDAQDAQNKLNLIAPKFFQLLIGIAQPLTGVDVPALIEEIKIIGGFNCDCCTAATGIVPTGSSSFDGYTFSIVPQGGDIDGTVNANGFNIQFLLHDVSYIVKICDGSPAQTTAFEFTPSESGDGYTKTYCLTIDVTQFGYDIGNAIAANADLLNFWQALIGSSGGSFTLIVDGGCIFSSSSTCDYELTLSNIPVNTTYALLTGIKIGTTTTPLTYSFNLTNLAGFQTYLNGLGLGTFVVTNPSGQTVLITSAANGNDIQQLSYKISATNYLADLSKNCTGFVPISANEVVQSIINYICEFDDSQLVTSDTYEICSINTTTNAKTITTVAAGQPLTTFITELLSKGCDTIDYIVSLSPVDCAGMLARFPAIPLVAMQANDVFLNTRAGACSQITPNEALLTMLTYGQYNVDVLAAFCNMVNLCAGGSPCAPYLVFEVEVSDPSPAGAVIDLVVTFTHPAAISHTIRYARIDNTVSPVYTTIPGILPGQSPYTIAGVQNGQYRVYIRPVYADGRLCSESVADTPACTGINSFSAEYDGTDINVTYTAEVSLDSVRVNISYPNGGSFTQVYANGDPIVITPPSGVYGTFFATLQPVCDPDSGFFGVATPPATFIINPPDNSSIINNSTLGQGELQIFTITPNGTPLAASALGVGETLPFYLADGTYGFLYVQVDTADRDTLGVSLLTGTGTYIGTPNGTNYFRFTNVPILNGATITLVDDTSPTELVQGFIRSGSGGSGNVINSVKMNGVDVVYLSGNNFPIGFNDLGNFDAPPGVTGQVNVVVNVSIGGTPPPEGLTVAGSDLVSQNQAVPVSGNYTFPLVQIGGGDIWAVEMGQPLS